MVEVIIPKWQTIEQREALQELLAWIRELREERYRNQGWDE